MKNPSAAVDGVGRIIQLPAEGEFFAAGGEVVTDRTTSRVMAVDAAAQVRRVLRDLFDLRNGGQAADQVDLAVLSWEVVEQPLPCN